LEENAVEVTSGEYIQSLGPNILVKKDSVKVFMCRGMKEVFVDFNTNNRGFIRHVQSNKDQI